MALLHPPHPTPTPAPPPPPPAVRREAGHADCGVVVSDLQPAVKSQLCSNVGLDPSAVSMRNPPQVQMEQGAEGLNQWHVASAPVHRGESGRHPRTPHGG